MSEGAGGIFVVFEGIDCSGSSTQARLLTSKLRSNGRRVFLTSEPSSGPVGQLIRTYFSGRLSTSFSRAAQDKFFGCMFAADRLDHVYNPTDGVLKQLSSGIDVISTRYKFSSLAYNAETTAERDFVLSANSELPDPEFLIYLNCPLQVSLNRMRERITRETYEKDTSKLEKALVNFEREIAQFAGHKLVLDASLPAKKLSEHVFEFIQNTRPDLFRTMAR